MILKLFKVHLSVEMQSWVKQNVTSIATFQFVFVQLNVALASMRTLSRVTSFTPFSRPFLLWRRADARYLSCNSLYTAFSKEATKQQGTTRKTSQRYFCPAEYTLRQTKPNPQLSFRIRVSFLVLGFVLVVYSAGQKHCWLIFQVVPVAI